MPQQRQKSTQVVNQGESLSVVLRGFVGLSLKLDFVNRPKTSFQQLDNFDLYIPGSIRKILPPTHFNGPFGGTLLNCIEYLAQPNNPEGGIRRVLGLGNDGNIYDLATPTPLVPYVNAQAELFTSQFTVPFMLQYSGYFVPFNIRAWLASTAYAVNDAVLAYGADGNVYVFRVTTPGVSAAVGPQWPSTGGIVDGGVIWNNSGQPNSARFIANFLCVIMPGLQPVRIVEWQYDPTSESEQPKITVGPMGVSPPEIPVQIGGLETTPNLNGYSPIAGRAYLWTLYNPQTLLESAPSPFVGKTTIVEVDNGDTQVALNGSILLPLPLSVEANKYQSYQSYYLAIPQYAVNPLIGQGYTSIRVYATKDGGSDFFLVPTLYDSKGVQISNADGSIPVSTLLADVNAQGQDYVPLPRSWTIQNSFRLYEGGGPINLAPDPQNLGTTSWSPGAGMLMFVSSGTAPTGDNSFEIDGTGSAFPLNTYKSIPIQLAAGQAYTFNIYIDNSAGSGGSVTAKIETIGGATEASVTQPDGQVGTIQTQWTSSGGKRKIVISVQGTTVSAGNSIFWSDPALYKGGVAFLQANTFYPTTDDTLVLPAPEPFTNYPPPVAAMAESIYDALFLVDYTDQTKIWYSQQGSFEQFGESSFVRTTVTKNADQILEIIKDFNVLIVGKGRSIEQIDTYPPNQPVPVDPQHGFIARRASITWGSSILGLLSTGLGQVRLSAAIEEDAVSVGYSEEVFGDDVKPIIDQINPATLYAPNTGPVLPCPSIYNTLDLFLLAYSLGATYSDNVLMYYLGKAGRGFSNITPLPAPLITLKEIQLAPVSSAIPGRINALPPGNGAYFMLALCNDSNVYVMFNGSQDGTLTATAVTQPLPTASDVPEEVLDTDKNFEYLYCEGSDLPNFQFSYAIDQEDTPLSQLVFTPPQQINVDQNRLTINKRGKTITIKITHSAITTNTPLLSMLKLAYSINGMRDY